MFSDYGQECIVSISPWDSLKIHVLSFTCGFWVILKRLAQWAWNPNGFFSLQRREAPPSCLVDSSLGRHSYVKLKGVKLHYVESGDRDKPLLLLLHGFPDCWLSWRYQIPVLAQHYRVIALDLKGFGDSDKPMWRRNYRVDKLLEELKEFVSALGVSSCTVIGHDLGAMLGWYLIHQYPDMVTKFVTVACPHPNVYWNELPTASTFNTRWVHFSQLPYLPEIDALKEDLSIINQCFHHLHKVNSKETYVEAYKYAFSRKEDWTGPINYYRNLPFSRVNEESSQVSVPCLLLTGNKDQFVNLESLVKSTDYVQNFSLKIVEGAGHFPHQELPDTVNNMLLTFLVVPELPPRIEKPVTSKGLVNRMFGAMSSTVKYGNQMVDVVQKKTNGVVSSLPTKALYFGQSTS